MSLTVLIVDDDNSKIDALKAALQSLSVNPGSIEIANDASQARQALKQRYFDIMLLDVLLPSRAGSRPAGDVSLDFLKEILEDGTSPAPGQVVAITANTSAMAQYEADFRKLTTQILHVEPTEDGWRQSLGSLVAHVRACAAASDAYDVDVCFQTALRAPELQALLADSQVSWRPEGPLVRGILCQQGEADWNSRRLRLVCAHASQMGLVAATHLADMLIHKFRPRVIVMTGICGGISNDVDFGDVIVADKSWDWQSGKWKMGQLQSAPDQKDASSELVAHARSVENLLVNYHLDYDGAKPGNPPRLHVGPMASGSSVVADPDFHEIFKAQHRKVSAVDMECYGLYYAAARSKEPAPKVLCIKSVSDMADKGKANNFQGFCSYLSAKVMFETLKRHFTTSGTDKSKG